MKNFNSKFSLVCEDTLYRYQQGGFLRGDYVTIKKNALSNENIKKMSEPLKAIIEDAIKKKTRFRISYLKSGRSEAPNGPVDAPNSASCIGWADVMIEYAPGMWKDPMTLPREVLEKTEIEGEMNGYPEYSKDIKRENDTRNDNVGTEEQTKGNDSNRKNPTKNTKLANTSNPASGHGTKKLHEQVQMLRENDNMFARFADSLKENKTNQRKYCPTCDNYCDCTKNDDGSYTCQVCNSKINSDEKVDEGMNGLIKAAQSVGRVALGSIDTDTFASDPEKLAHHFSQIKKQDPEKLKSLIRQMLDRGQSDQVAAAVSFQKDIDSHMGDG